MRWDAKNEMPRALSVQTVDHARLVEEFFESDAAFWKVVYGRSDVFSATIQRRHAIALAWTDRLGLASETPVLEVGCGAGLLAVALGQRGLSVQAVDPAPAMVAQAQRRATEGGVGQRVRVSTGDVHALDLPDASVELVIALGVLPWLHTPERAVQEMARVLTPGGWLILSSDNRSALVDLLDPLRNPALAPLKVALKRTLGVGQPPAECPPRADRRKDTDRTLLASGLRKVDDTTCGFGPLTIFRRQLLPAGLGAGLERRLQALADRRVPLVRAAGWHYMVLAQKVELSPIADRRIVGSVPSRDKRVV
jgi:ubiquinone/menaquinone biosynthesis C-methylase UbiE